MPYLPNVNSYLHQSSLLLQAYPDTTRITTKYSLPRRKTQKQTEKREEKRQKPASSSHHDNHTQGIQSEKPPTTREHPPPPSTLTFKTFETTSGICLKYHSNKAAEVGRLMTGLGRLARREVIEEPAGESSQKGIKDVKLLDPATVEAGALSPADTLAKGGEGPVTPTTPTATSTATGGGKGKKRKGKK